MLTDKHRRVALQDRASRNILFQSQRRYSSEFCSPEIPPSRAPTAVGVAGISPTMKYFKFFPSPRKLAGPKKKMTLRDHAFAISSATAVKLLSEEREKKNAIVEKKNERKSRKSTGKKSSGTSVKRRLEKSLEEAIEEDSSSDESSMYQM